MSEARFPAGGSGEAPAPDIFKFEVPEMGFPAS